MPFTPAHIAAILPIAAVVPRALPFSALVVGSMIPDLPLFVPLPPHYMTTHSIHGIFVANVPMGLACLLFFDCLMKRPLIALLPDVVRSRCAPLVRRDVKPTVSYFASSSVAIAIGAATHVFWDSFTHAGRWGTLTFPVLFERFFTIGGHDVPGWLALQYGCTFVFLPLVLIMAAVWLARQPPAPLEGLPRVSPLWRAAVYLSLILIPIMVTTLVWTLDWWTLSKKLFLAVSGSGLAIGMFLLAHCAGYYTVRGLETR